MPVKQYSISSGEVVIPPDAADKLLSCKNGDAALLYIYIAKNGGRLDESAAARRLAFDSERLSRALESLETTGLLRGGQAAACEPAIPAANEEMPVYSAGELAQGMEGEPAFRHLVDEAQRKLGKVLTQTELSTLFGLYDRFGMPAGVLLLLITHCVSEAGVKYGEGRLPTMRQIEREAYVWSRMGIYDETRAEEHLKALELRRTATSRIMRALQIGGRAPSASEERYMHEWLGMGFEVEAIYRAYDITVVKTGGLKWRYMDSILKSWHAKGLHLPEEIEEGDRPQKSRDAESAPGTQEKKALEWLKNYKPAGPGALPKK